jgi:hypothetical protein
MKTLLFVVACASVAAFCSGMLLESRLEAQTCRALSIFEHPTKPPIAASGRQNVTLPGSGTIQAGRPPGSVTFPRIRRIVTAPDA